MKKLLVGVGILVLIMGVGYVYAHGPWYGPTRGSGYGLGPRGGYCLDYGDVEKGPSITSEQRSKFQEMRRKFDDETARLRTSIFAKRQELRSLWDDTKADPDAMLQKEKELRNLENKLQDKAAAFKIEARKNLTPEQLSMYGERETRPGYGPRFGHGYGRGPGYGMGPGSGFCY